MSKDREFDKRKKFMMELLGDPVYQPMRFREIAGLLRLSKDEKKDPCLLYTSDAADD